jgi:hypothetical protein
LFLQEQTKDHLHQPPDSFSAKKTQKKEPLKTAKEKKEEKREKKNSPKRD